METTIAKPKFNLKSVFTKENFQEKKPMLIQWGSLILVIIVFSILTQGNIFSRNSMRTLLAQIVPLMIMCCGMVFVFAHNGFDIASGSVLGMCAMVNVLIYNATKMLWLGLLVSILMSVALYFLECLISIRLGLVTTIGSLAIMFAGRGVVTYVCSLNNGTVRISDYSALSSIKNNTGLQIGVLVAVVLVSLFLFDLTKIGKEEKAIGDNDVSARQSGVHVEAIKYFSYMYAGLLVGIASIFTLARAGTVTRAIGSGNEMDIMVAIILGGMNLNGGSKSRMSAAIIGCITYRLLSLGMTMAGVPTSYISLVKGILFLVIIFMTLRQSKQIKEMPR